MAENLTISSPDIPEIRKKAGNATADAVNLLWSALNEVDASRRRTVREAKEQFKKKKLRPGEPPYDADFDIDNAAVVEFTSSSAGNFSGIRNPIEGQIVIFHNTGSGTVTLKHNTTSLAANRLFLDTSADKSLTQDSSIIFLYLNGGWKEMNLL